MPETRILIVVKDVEAANAYCHDLSEIGVACAVAGSFNQMSAMITEHSFHGILIDILTLVRCTKEEKVIAYEAINLFPVLRVKWEAQHKKIKLSPLEQSFSPDTETALRFFIENRCKTFRARRLRSNARKLINLNLLYSTDATFPEGDTHRSFTVDIGLDGVFLHTMQEFQKGETIWLRFLEFADESPIPATVCWSRKWGATRCIPGVGVRFQGLTADQERQIHTFFSL